MDNNLCAVQKSSTVLSGMAAKKKRKGAKVRVFKLRCPFALEEFQKEGEAAAAQRNSERSKGKEQRWCSKNKVKVCLKLQQQLTKVSRPPAPFRSPLKDLIYWHILHPIYCCYYYYYQHFRNWRVNN